MTSQPDKQTESPPPGEGPAGPEAAARAARRKRWDRITWAIIAAMVVVCAVGLFFRQELRARYWAWRLSRAEGPAQREKWAGALESLGEAAYGPAIDLTRSDDAAIRLAGARVLTDVLWAEQAERQRQAKEGQGAPPISAPRVAGRFRELLGDADRRVKFEAMAGLVLLRDKTALPRLSELASGAADPATVMQALCTLADIDRVETGDADSGRQAAEALRKVLADSDDPNVRAQAIDCLEWYPSDATLTALADALLDLRAVTIPPRSEQFDPELLALVQKEMLKRGMAPGPLAPPARGPQSQPDAIGGPSQPEAAPTTQPARRKTVADYADRALRMLTNEDFGFDSAAPQSDRDAVIQRWRDFIRRKQA